MQYSVVGSLEYLYAQNKVNSPVFVSIFDKKIF